MKVYQDYWFNSDDGLTLYARDYQNKKAKNTIICIPGLTRNSADFSLLSEELSKTYRVIAVDLRGRGLSQYDSNALNYHPLTYANDMITLFNSLKLNSVILIGTSLGGLVSIILTSMKKDMVDGVVLNDIGPEANITGLNRIKDYISQRHEIDTWSQAIKKTQETLQYEYPEFTEQEWSVLTRNLYRSNSEGKPVLNYDSNITVPIEESNNNAIPPDLWDVFNTLVEIPLLVIRGGVSDILSIECVDKMKELHPGMFFTEVKGCGHAPLLTEPEAMDSIMTLLSSLEH